MACNVYTKQQWLESRRFPTNLFWLLAVTDFVMILTGHGFHLLSQVLLLLYGNQLCMRYLLFHTQVKITVLVSSLRPWTDPSVELKWKWYFEWDLNQVYQRQNDCTWNVFFGSGRRRGSATYWHDGLTEANKPDTSCFLISMGVHRTTGTGF